MRIVAAALAFSLVATPLLAASFRERACAAATSGVWRAQNTGQITTGTIRSDDSRRSALAFGISGAAAFVGAALWRFVPCHGVKDAQQPGGVPHLGYNKCFDDDGNRRGFDTPTKLLLGAGVALEVVALGYLIAHLRQGDDDDVQDAR